MRLPDVHKVPAFAMSKPAATSAKTKENRFG